MGGILSSEEKEEVAPHFLGFNPLQLTSLVWDCIHEVEINPGEAGSEDIAISFNGGFGLQRGSSDNVVFCDGGKTTEMPKKVFLEIVRMSSEEIIKTYEQQYDLELSGDMGFAVSELKKALECLSAHIATIKGEEGLKEYKRRLDTEEDTSDDETCSEWEESGEEEEEEGELEPGMMVSNSGAAGGKEKEVEELSDNTPPMVDVPVMSTIVDEEGGMVSPITITDAAAIATAAASAKNSDSTSSDDSSGPPTPPSAEYLSQRRSSRGIVGVMDRIPDLRKRVSTSDDESSSPRSPPSPAAVEKVQKKVKMLSMFHVKREGRSPTSEDEVSPPRSPLSPVQVMDKVKKKVKMLSMFHIKHSPSSPDPMEEEEEEEEVQHQLQQLQQKQLHQRPSSLSLQTSVISPQSSSKKVPDKQRSHSTPGPLVSSSALIIPNQPSAPGPGWPTRVTQRSKSTPYFHPAALPTMQCRSLSTPQFGAHMPTSVILPGSVEMEQLETITLSQENLPSPHSPSPDDVFTTATGSATTTQLRWAMEGMVPEVPHHTISQHLAMGDTSPSMPYHRQVGHSRSPLLSSHSMESAHSLSLGSLEEVSPTPSVGEISPSPPQAEGSRVYFNFSNPTTTPATSVPSHLKGD